MYYKKEWHKLNYPSTIKRGELKEYYKKEVNKLSFPPLWERVKKGIIRHRKKEKEQGILAHVVERKKEDFSDSLRKKKKEFLHSLENKAD